jgi:meromycolic acid (3R)-3-hydroxyacyl-[acyl-carrier protein] dehydratase HadB
VSLLDARPGDEIPACSRRVTREDLGTYAELSGDRNPLHQDDAAARAAGFDGVIAHGMFTMGHLAACLDRWIGGRGVVEHISAQFRAAVSPGETIVAGGRVRDVDQAAETVLLELWVTVDRAGVTEHAVRKGEARIRLAQPAS